jgi:hypothetical protein
MEVEMKYIKIKMEDVISLDAADAGLAQETLGVLLIFSRGFRICSGGPNRGGYTRDGFLSLFHGPAYVGHQLFQIVLGDFKLRRLFVHFHLPIGSPSQGNGPPAVFRAKVNSL